MLRQTMFAGAAMLFAWAGAMPAAHGANPDARWPQPTVGAPAAPVADSAAAPAIDSAEQVGATADMSDAEAFLELQEQMYAQQQASQFLSDMLWMQHQTNMMMIYNMGSGWTYE